MLKPFRHTVQRTEPRPDPKDLATILADLDNTLARQVKNETRKNRIIAIIVVISIVCASGWWLTSNDHSATTKNGQVADCRADMLALRLDEFSIIVSPLATRKAKDAAARQISESPTLRVAYAKCSRDN